MCLVFVVEKLGPVFKVTLSLNGITTGALLGLFTMGILFRKANTKVTVQMKMQKILQLLIHFQGVLWGTAISVVVVSVIVAGSFNETSNSTLLLRTDGCDHNGT